MADAMDTLEGRRDDKERVWNTIQKVKLSKLKGKKTYYSQKEMSLMGQIYLEDKKKSSYGGFSGCFCFNECSSLSQSIAKLKYGFI